MVMAARADAAPDLIQASNLAGILCRDIGYVREHGRGQRVEFVTQ
jgi:hypothetical protein